MAKTKTRARKGARSLKLKRSLAAKKGWATRRKNQRAFNRTETGKRFKKMERNIAKSKRILKRIDKNIKRKEKALKKGNSYANLAQFIKAYESWDGEYDYFEIETSADY